MKKKDKSQDRKYTTTGGDQACSRQNREKKANDKTGNMQQQEEIKHA